MTMTPRSPASLLPKDPFVAAGTLKDILEGRLSVAAFAKREGKMYPGAYTLLFQYLQAAHREGLVRIIGRK